MIEERSHGRENRSPSAPPRMRSPGTSGWCTNTSHWFRNSPYRRTSPSVCTKRDIRSPTGSILTSGSGPSASATDWLSSHRKRRASTSTIRSISIPRWYSTMERRRCSAHISTPRSAASNWKRRKPNPLKRRPSRRAGSSARSTKVRMPASRTHTGERRRAYQLQHHRPVRRERQRKLHHRNPDPHQGAVCGALTSPAPTWFPSTDAIAPESGLRITAELWIPNPFPSGSYTDTRTPIPR